MTTIEHTSLQQYRSLDGKIEIEVISATPDTITYCQAGGGFIREMDASILASNFQKIEVREMKKALVTADFLEDSPDNFPEFPCYSDGLLWNGWGQPFFEKSVLMEVISLINKTCGDNLRIENDLFYFESEDGRTPGEPEESVAMTTIVVEGKPISGYHLNMGWMFNRCVPLDEAKHRAAEMQGPTP